MLERVTSPMGLLLLGLVGQVALHLEVPVATAVVWPWNAAGAAVLAGGIGLMVAGERRFERAGVSVRPDTPPAALVTDGVYAWSRNPMYVGLVGVLLGAGVLLGTLTPLLVPPVVGWSISVRFIRREEAALRWEFGECYERYRQDVRRWL